MVFIPYIDRERAKKKYVDGDCSESTLYLQKVYPTDRTTFHGPNLCLPIVLILNSISSRAENQQGEIIRRNGYFCYRQRSLRSNLETSYRPRAFLQGRSPSFEAQFHKLSINWPV